MVSVVYTAVRLHGSRKQGCASTSPVSCTISTAAEPCSLTHIKGCSFELYLAQVDDVVNEGESNCVSALAPDLGSEKKKKEVNHKSKTLDLLTKPRYDHHI